MAGWQENRASGSRQCQARRASAARSATRRTAPPDGLCIHVARVGTLSGPVSAAEGQAADRPRATGAVRARRADAHRRASAPYLGGAQEPGDDRHAMAKQTLTPMLAVLRANSGLPQGCRLKAELHSVLVYAPGQFFVPHQDSEKSDAMVGTLSVILPGSAKGGALVIEHAGSKVTYRASDKLLTFAAFYADCRHEVRPVRSGTATHRRLLRRPRSCAHSFSTSTNTSLHEADVAEPVVGDHDVLVQLTGRRGSTSWTRRSAPESSSGSCRTRLPLILGHDVAAPCSAAARRCTGQVRRPGLRPTRRDHRIGHSRNASPSPRRLALQPTRSARSRRARCRWWR